ncbi:F-box protein PP2-A13-like [Iris pallida]|uniref:F-box protein PP2-A13-like n=1 Tax=Iris pallida TaxID=29817 RepID=A0AAX6HR53_IRIPA|nr:F-box protein PP2-A13-like [Iris pallida]KAJ6843193.1 F-box protein PP2-A13-like [Iris pallida]
MGAGGSSALAADAESSAREVGLGDLPESCVAAVMVHLDSAEICRLARLSRSFRGAAAADFVWETKLPANYRYLIEKACSCFSSGSDEEEVAMTKKGIYARLCRPIPFDGGTKEFWMEKSRGGICMAISSKGLAITGIEDRRYWNYIPTEESRFHTVACLQQIWWLEVAGEVDFCFPAGTYSLYFRLHLGRPTRRLGCRICNHEHVHGWNIKPVKFQLRTSDGQHALYQCHLDKPGCWNRYHVGDFVVEKPDMPTKVKFSMTQIDCTHTKGGVCVDSVLIYPKGFRQDNYFRTYM